MNERAISPASLLLICLAAASFECSAAERIAAPGELAIDGSGVHIPLLEGSMHPKVIVDMGDGQEYAFVVDTGAAVNVLDSAIAESLGLAQVGEMQIGAPGGPQIPGKIVNVPHASIGQATIKNAEFVTMDLNAFSGGSMQGVLGMALFRDYLLTYDYSRNEIKLSREALATDAPGVMPYTDKSGHIEVNMNVAGTAVVAHLDTGSMGGFTLPIDMKPSLPLKPSGQGAATARVVGGDRDIQFGQLDGDIQFAGTRYTNPRISFMDPSPGYGNVGSRVLSDFIVSIDQRRQLIRFEKNSQQRPASPGNAPRRLGVQFRGMPGGGPLTVGHVEPGSLAEKSGIKAGDILVGLNGRPSGDYDMATMGALFRGTEPLQIEVDRGGERRLIGIQ